MKIWKFSPGRNGRYWEYCRNKQVAAIGWSRFGDLSNYSTFEELSLAFNKKGFGSGMWNTGDTQLWNFCTKCNIGDIIVAYSNGHILGKGKIKSLYFFANEPIDPIINRWFSHRRKVQWENNTQKDIRENNILYGNPRTSYGTLNKQLTFYEIEDEYSKNYILRI